MNVWNDEKHANWKFYGTEKLLVIGSPSSSNSTVATIVDGDLRRAQAKRFKKIMCEAVPSIREAVEMRRQCPTRHQEEAREDRARGAEQPEQVDEGEERPEVKSLTQYVWAYLLMQEVAGYFRVCEAGFDYADHSSEFCTG